MVKLTMIARVTDGLPLAEGLDDGRDQDIDFYKHQAKLLFKNLSKGHIEASRMSIETGPYYFHYIIEGCVCYLTMCDRSYPKKLAFQYLDDLKNEFERVWGSRIETVARPYGCIKFDTFIQRTKELYLDTRTQRNLAKLNDELYEHQIMTRNVQEVLGVGEKLDQVSQMSKRLTSNTRMYAEKAKDLDRQLESLPALVAGVYSDDVTMQLETTMQFRKLLSIEGSPPIEEVIQTGVVPRFVEFLTREDFPQLQVEAGWALTNIASGTSENTMVVIDYGAVPIFVKLLGSSSDDVREQAMWALGNVAGDSPKCRDLVLAGGALIPVLAHLNGHAKLSMLRNATWTLSNLCRGKPQPPFEQVKPALLALEYLIHSDDEEVLSNVCWALSHLSNGTYDKIEAVIEAGVCPRLVELFYIHSSPSVLNPALRTIGNIVTADDVQNRVLPFLSEKHDEFMLRELVLRWSNHKVMVRWLSGFAPCPDRDCVSRRSLPALNEVGLTCFRDLVYEEIKGKVRGAVISLIEQEREGEQIDRALLKNVLDIFVEIGQGNMECYNHDFEAAMLEDTAAYYSRKASNWILEDSCPDYMLKAEECLKREENRVSHYLHLSSEQKLLEVVQNELLATYETQLIEKEHSGCHALLHDDKVDDLSRMYRLFCKITRGLYAFSQIFKQHVIAEGTSLVKQEEDAANHKEAGKEDVVGMEEQIFVRKVIELHDKYLGYVNDCFQNHSLFHQALKEAFEVFCNKDVAGSSSAELLATFCDNILKKGGREKLSDEAIEEMLEKVLRLLAYINDKDYFAEFYRKKLARRLLFDKIANFDKERSILTKLKQQCGRQFTLKMEGMVTDLTLAREHQTNFEEYLNNNPQTHPGIDLTVTVLTAGFWPSYKSFDLNLPAEMVKCVEVFREFYQTTTKQRKLTWIYSLGTCNIIGKFDAKPIEMVVTTYQASALLLFNASDKLSYSEIKEQLNLTDDDVVRLLHSLSCAKYNILSKEPHTKSISPTDVFEFNSKFTDKMRRIKIPLPPVDQKKKIILDVDKDRRYAIDASIVRIMKSRKVLGYQQLVMECVEQLRFKPDIKAIKKRIEDLITRDYLERDKKNPNVFRYLA